MIDPPPPQSSPSHQRAGLPRPPRAPRWALALAAALVLLAGGGQRAEGAGVKYTAGGLQFALPIGWRLVRQRAFPTVPFLFTKSGCGNIYVAVATLDAPIEPAAFARKSLDVLLAQGFVAGTLLPIVGSDAVRVDLRPPEGAKTMRLRQIYGVAGLAGYVLTLACPASGLEVCGKDLDLLHRDTILAEPVSPSDSASSAPSAP